LKSPKFRRPKRTACEKSLETGETAEFSNFSSLLSLRAAQELIVQKERSSSQSLGKDPFPSSLATCLDLNNPKLLQMSHIQERNQDATVYCGDIDAQVNEALLWELFLQAGPVVNVHIPKDKLTQQHMGYGFVEFNLEEDADYAMKIMNMIKLFGKPIKVNKVCLTTRETPFISLQHNNHQQIFVYRKYSFIKNIHSSKIFIHKHSFIPYFYSS